MKFYEYTQNNSGGSWETDENLCHRVVIEADDETDANYKAETFGVYFNGVEDGDDCECCGDRWDLPDEIQLPFRFGTLSKKEASEIAGRYKASYDKTTWKFMGTHEPDSDKFDVIFETIESYMQYLSDKYGATKPDARIFYENGNIKEIQ